MKRIITLLALCFITLLFSQEKTYSTAMDSLLFHVDKSALTTNILYDRTFSICDLNTSTAPPVSYNYFMQAWNELHTSSFSPNFQSADSLQEQVRIKERNNKIIVGVINLKINYLDYGTASDPKLTFSNGYFWNVPDKNPFLEKSITLIKPLSDTIQNNTVTYIIDKNFIAQDSHSTPLSSLQIDFGDGVSHTYNVSGNFPPVEQPVLYTSAGIKSINIQLNYTDGTTQSLQNIIQVNFPESSVSKLAGNYNEFEDFIYANGITQSIPFKGYNESIATSGKLEYRTYYNTVSNPGYNPSDHSFSVQPKLRKPVIILDGFDPSNTRKLVDLYKLMEYDVDGNPNTNDRMNLVEQLRLQGFDVTLVNFQNGADFIERNAMALVALLQRENAKLITNGSTEQLTIVGPSMGGLVSRYALAYMEKNNLPHNTRLWVSFDSPHLGANIPISTQRNLYFYGFIGGAQQAKTKYIENFRSPAARQMLIEQLDAYPISTSYYATQGMNNNAPFRQQFLQNLNSNGLANSNGFPQNVRRIAITNGTTSGAKTNNETDCILEMAAFKRVLGAKIKVATLVDYNLAKPNNAFLNFEGRYTIPGFLSITVLNSKIFLTNSNPRGSMDVVQGGTFNTQEIIKDEFTPVLNEDTSFHEWRQFKPTHSFIPTVSSLAFKNYNFDWNTDISRNLLCNNEIPFDTYFVPVTNQKHIDITNDLVVWLTNEINGQIQPPSFPVNPEQLEGPTPLCLNTINTYFFSNACKVPGIPVWSVSDNLQILSNTDYSVTVQAIASGNASITATFATGSVTKNIVMPRPKLLSFALENPAPPYYCITPPELLEMSIESNYVRANFTGMTLAEINNSQNWEWQPDNNLITLSGSGNKRIICPVGTGYTSFKVRARNGCSWSEWYQYPTFQIKAKPIVYFTVAPNPATETLSVSLENNNIQLPTSASSSMNVSSGISAKLYDSLGNQKANFNLINNAATIDINHLPAGVYYLKILIGNKLESHTVIKQ